MIYFCPEHCMSVSKIPGICPPSLKINFGNQNENAQPIGMLFPLPALRLEKMGIHVE